MSASGHVTEIITYKCHHPEESITLDGRLLVTHRGVHVRERFK